MTTAFAATLRNGPEVWGINTKAAVYQIQMPNSTTAGGETCDVSGSMSYVRGGSCNISAAVTDLKVKYGIEGGTINTTYYGYPAATIAIVVHQSAGSNTVMDEADGVDLSAVDDMLLTVWGA
ncbi:MAG: hypothetical protein GY851_07600 [bacterium]|nr:hypothetical protein [bacterium]